MADSTQTENIESFLTPMKPPYSMTNMAMVLFGLSALLDSGNADDITM